MTQNNLKTRKLLSMRIKFSLISIVYYFLISCSSENQKYAIAYNVLVDEKTSNYDVFSMNLDGSQKENITKLAGVEWTYSSSGNDIYFVSDKDSTYRVYYLYRTNDYGKTKQKVYDKRLRDSWMGFNLSRSEIIVKPHKSVDSAFHIISTEGQLIQRLEIDLANYADPIFVEHGDAIVFRGGTKKSKKEEGYREEIYRIDRDAKHLTQLSTYPEMDKSAPWYAYKAGPPRLHPTENFISYTSFQNGKYSLYAVTLDGKKQWKLTNTNFWEAYHDWSPDGKWLVMDLTNEKEKHYDIGLMHWESKALTILTDSSYHYQQAPNFVLK